MWRRAYLLLILVRLYFALSPSYLHPDENFQGPEVIAGRVFSYPVHLTWEFTSENPIRSAFPLWLIYGPPMYILNSLWEGIGNNEVPPHVVYWTLRLLMFILSFVLEDWALYELVQSPRQRRLAIILVASSYVTWTYQTHTFSNAVETIILLWSLVLVGRIVEDRKRSNIFTSAILSFLIVLGTFNRITFPAFLLVPSLPLLTHFRRKPLSLLSILFFGALATCLAVIVDTAFYTSDPFTLSLLWKHPIITPLNNLLYNTSSVNLAKHGLHPYYQHFVANLPQLLGPAYPLLAFSYRNNLCLVSAFSGIILLSFFPHQEARFLLPAIPLILSSIRLPKHYTRVWIGVWVIFNVFMGFLMGVYHQGGVVPMQMFLANQENLKHALWWKTYSPPIWLLNGKNEEMTTTDLMGMAGPLMVQNLTTTACFRNGSASGVKSYPEGDIVLVAPRSATFLDQYKGLDGNTSLNLERVWSHRNHLNLDDLDFAEDGVWPTLTRVVGRRGLTAWKVTVDCSEVRP